MLNTGPIRVLFNDSHVNLPSNTQVPQGGPSRFSQMFANYFGENKTKVELISLLFSHNPQNKKIFVRETSNDRKFFELVYPKEILNDSYKKEYTKKRFFTFLKPFMNEMEIIFEKAKPDIVFINGFGLTNWMILENAYKRKIPICIQHAGIWKKELQVSQEHFSPSVRKIFSSIEKEVFKKSTHQIFLNEFSRDVFCKLHNISKTEIVNKSSIIPIPVDINKTYKIFLQKRNTYNIGMVARWDRIKNHASIMRLATYMKKKHIQMILNVVTKWPVDIVSNFKNKYEKLVSVIPVMIPDKLKNFYLSQDLIIIPSRFDVSPMVLIEALSCGKPTIISNKTGWGSHYKKFGLEKMIISPNASGEKIFNTIDLLIKNNDKYITKFQKLQKKLIIDHDPKLVFKKYYQTFNNLKK
jgi:glycosyltransferase involved in cell wall biosynthesis